MQSKKILIVSRTYPEQRMGGAAILWRHFVERKSYDFSVLTNAPVSASDIAVQYVSEPKWLQRMKRTRFSLWFHDYTHLVHAKLFDRRLEKAARRYRPDIVFNVAETYFSHHAMRLAHRLNVPFVCYFMDWAHYATLQHPYAIPYMEKSFRHLYRRSDVALCISEGMKEELGPHRNARVVFPIGGTINLPPVRISYPHAGAVVRGTKFNVCFAGNLWGWYGEQVARLMRAAEHDKEINLNIYGANHDWSAQFEQRQRDMGVFHGFRAFADLTEAYSDADLLLVVMGFNADAQLIERTSFKTKLLDYLQCRRPVLVWGPSYSSAVKVASRFGFAHCVTDPSADAVLRALRRLAQDKLRRKELVDAARVANQQIFAPDIVHQKFVDAIESAYTKQ